jgi:ATPase subunit of ABC transporter with duplicated ATPase domains
VRSRFPDVDKISPPLLQLSGVDFGYTPEKQILKNVYIDIGLDSRIAVVGANGAGKLYTMLLIVVLNGTIRKVDPDQALDWGTAATVRAYEPEWPLKNVSGAFTCFL